MIGFLFSYKQNLGIDNDLRNKLSVQTDTL